MAFARNHTDKELAALGYYSEGIKKAVKSTDGGLSLVTNAFSNVLRDTEMFGDTRMLIAYLKEFETKENNFYAKASEENMGLVASYDEGFKLDFYLGKDYPRADIDSKRKLANMANYPGTAIYGSWISDVNYSMALKEYYTAIWRLAYEGARFIKLKVNVNKEAKTFRHIETMLAGGVLKFWNALDVDLRQGLSAEQVFMLDLDVFPSVVSSDASILENVGSPRFTVAHSVVDREKVSASWDKIDTATKDIANGIKNLTGVDYPLADLKKVKGYGLNAWSYQLGTFHLDNSTKKINLTVALDDQLWLMTSSPTILDKLVTRIKEEGGRQADPGAELVLP